MNNNLDHEVKLSGRSLLNLTGISKIVSFNDEEFFLESNMGNLHIKGLNLEVIKMDTNDGNVKLKGTINSFVYIENKIKNKEDSIFTKLFR